MKLRYLHSLIAATLALTASAQELNESMTVQGAYDPVIRKHERISNLPDKPLMQEPTASLPIEFGGSPVNVAPTFNTAEASNYGTTLGKPVRGYLDLQAGSFLNTSVSAGYRAVATPRTSLALWLQHNSSSLFRANDHSPYRRRYDETLGARFSQIFTPGTLSLAASYHLGYFNYYRALPEINDDPLGSAEHQPIPGTQTLNDASFKAAWRGTRHSTGFNYDASVSYRYFGFRRLYEWSDESDMAYLSSRPARENDIAVDANLAYTPTAPSTFSLGLQGRWLPYSNSDVATPGFYSITPGYTLTLPSLTLRVGAQLSLTSSITGYEKFSTFHAAPDVALSFSAGRFIASLSAKGGVTPCTLAGLHELDYYSTPTLFFTTPVYSPIDATLRLGFGSISGVSGGISASYASQKNTPLAGLYPLYLFHQQPGASSYILTPGYLNIHGFSLGADFRIAIGDVFTLQADMTYSPQSGSRGSFNGIDRPRWVVNAEASICPVKPLNINVGFDYRGVRNLYYRSAPRQPLAAIRLPNMNDLHASASYTFAQKYTIGVMAANILSSNPWTCREMPLEGFTLMGRFAVIF